MLATDEHSNILIYMNGHGGDQFLKFHDKEEVSSHDLGGALREMELKKRYHRVCRFIFIVGGWVVRVWYTRYHGVVMLLFYSFGMHGGRADFLFFPDKSHLLVGCLLLVLIGLNSCLLRIFALDGSSIKDRAALSCGVCVRRSDFFSTRECKGSNSQNNNEDNKRAENGVLGACLYVASPLRRLIAETVPD